MGWQSSNYLFFSFGFTKKIPFHTYIKRKQIVKKNIKTEKNQIAKKDIKTEINPKIEELKKALIVFKNLVILYKIYKKNYLTK